jgi:RNA polymerase subunit RPABC4/transcription elongation factor Spt4
MVVAQENCPRCGSENFQIVHRYVESGAEVRMCYGCTYGYYLKENGRSTPLVKRAGGSTGPLLVPQVGLHLSADLPPVDPVAVGTIEFIPDHMGLGVHPMPYSRSKSCDRCSNWLPETARYCRVCGYRLNAKETVTWTIVAFLSLLVLVFIFCAKVIFSALAA